MPVEGEGCAPKLGIGGGVEGGGVHASNAAEKVAVEGLCGCCGFGGAWGKCPYFAGVGEDGRDEGVKELAEGGGGGDAELSAAAVQGMQRTLASSVEMGRGGGDAFLGVKCDAQVAVGVGGGDGGGAKVPVGGGGARWGWRVEHYDLRFGKVDVQLGGEAKGV